jgi:drug/metabolite transporter (DMT)-like permease
MDTRQPVDARAMGLMTVLCLIWGLQQVFLKLAADDVTPLMQIALRSGIATVLVGLMMGWQGVRISLSDGTWRPGLLVGVLFGLEFLLIGEGLRFTSASHLVVFLYTAPIFVALALHWKLPAERLSAVQWLGVALAFCGIVAAFFGPAAADSAWERMLLGDFLALLAGIAWGATTVAVRLSRLAKEPATITLFFQLAIGFILLLAAAIALDQTAFRPTQIAWISLIFQSVIVCFASYLAWFWLLKKYLASSLGVLSFMTPLFGVAFGVWLLDEPLEKNFLLGSLLVIAGIVLVNRRGAPHKEKT